MNEDPENDKHIDTPVEWRDSDMPYSNEFGDYYYSKMDGRKECDHVFIKGNNLHERFESADHIVIAELGFGTGLNFLETVRQFVQLSKSTARLEFHSFELFPLTAAQIEKALLVWPEIEAERGRLIDQWPSSFDRHIELPFSTNMKLQLHIGDVNETIHDTDFQADAWYLDGFAPAKNTEMWNDALMRELAKRTKTGGTLASYTAAGWVRRNLQAAGFEIEKRDGYANKRDMITGVKVDKVQT